MSFRFNVAAFIAAAMLTLGLPPLPAAASPGDLHLTMAPSYVLVATSGRTFTATALDDAGAPVVGRLITLSVDTKPVWSCTATTNAAGVATCDLQVSEWDGTQQATVTASFGGDATYAPTSVSRTYDVVVTVSRAYGASLTDATHPAPTYVADTGYVYGPAVNHVNGYSSEPRARTWAESAPSEITARAEVDKVSDSYNGIPVTVLGAMSYRDYTCDIWAPFGHGRTYGWSTYAVQAIQIGSIGVGPLSATNVVGQRFTVGPLTVVVNEQTATETTAVHISGPGFDRKYATTSTDFRNC